jgi:tetratricopeptide (TPR) repeat protein
MMKNTESIAFLKQTPAAAQLEFKQGFRRPPSEEEFVKILNEKGIDNAKQIYQEVTKNDPDYRLFNSDSLSTVAKKMLQGGKTKEAIEVLQLNLEAHPDEWRVLDALGNAHMTAGDKTAAIKYFGKSLEINPDNTTAAEMIKKLQQSP